MKVKIFCCLVIGLFLASALSSASSICKEEHISNDISNVETNNPNTNPNILGFEVVSIVAINNYPVVCGWHVTLWWEFKDDDGDSVRCDYRPGGTEFDAFPWMSSASGWCSTPGEYTETIWFPYSTYKIFNGGVGVDIDGRVVDENSGSSNRLTREGDFPYLTSRNMFLLERFPNAFPILQKLLQHPLFQRLFVN